MMEGGIDGWREGVMEGGNDGGMEGGNDGWREGVMEGGNDGRRD